MLYGNRCRVCGKIFPSKSSKTLYCSVSCRKEGVKPTKGATQGQLCWECKKSTGLCSWSHEFIPIKDWKAKPVFREINGKELKTYCITECPEFMRR